MAGGWDTPLRILCESHPRADHFQLIACNNDGVCNRHGAFLDFVILAAWYQTLWFKLLCVSLALALSFLSYRYKLRQAAALLRTRFDERLEERTRLARDLHDTLIQTIQGSKLVADNAKEGPPDLVKMQKAVHLLSEWLGRATVEMRAALSSLRSSEAERNDLVDALRRAAEDCRVNASLHVSVTVRGSSREMQPIVRDEVYRIAYEAINNACTHSGGTQVAVELEYGRDFQISIRDNGRGIDSPALEFGKPGHFGLKGMRERAQHIGGKLTLSSSSQKGTQIKLLVPGKIIFKPH